MLAYQVEKVISEPLDSGVMNTLIALEKSRQTSRMAMGALRGEVCSLIQLLAASSCYSPPYLFVPVCV